MGNAVTIYHNPRCGKSRSALSLLQEKGIEPTVVEYLKTPPSRGELRSLVAKLGIAPEQLVRKGEDVYKEKFKGALPETKREPLLAEVGDAPEPHRGAMCWVIAYRSGDARAKTWVRVSDGKVLRQEAVLMEDRIALERDE